MMLEHRQHDPVARLQIGAAPALGDEVDPLGRAADEDDLVGRRRADEAGDPPPRRLEGEGHLRRALVDAAMDGRIGFGIAARDRVDHRLRLLRRGGGVEIGPAFGDRREVGDMVEGAGGDGDVHQPSQLHGIGVESLAHRLLADPVDRVGDEGAGEQGLGLGFGNAAAGHVEEGVAVELADGGAVGAFDVVGEDLELGLGVDRRGAREEQALQRLLAVRLLGVAGDLDPGGDRADARGRRRPSARPGGWCRAAARGGRRNWRHDAAGRAPAGRRPPRHRRLRRRGGSRRRAGCRRRPPARVVTTRLAPSPTPARSVKLTKPARRRAAGARASAGRP